MVTYKERKNGLTNTVAFCKPTSTQDNEKKKQNIIAKKNNRVALHDIGLYLRKYSLQGTTQGNGLTGGVPPVRFSM